MTDPGSKPMDKRKREDLKSLPALIVANIQEVPNWEDSGALITARAHAVVLDQDLPETFEELQAENEWLKGEVAELTKALTGLTCGGSEFFVRKRERYVADIKACVDYIERVNRDAHERALRFARERKAAEAQLTALRASLEPVVEAAEKAAGWFRDYQRQHEAKGSQVEGARYKAATNAARAAVCESAAATARDVIRGERG